MKHKFKGVAAGWFQCEECNMETDSPERFIEERCLQRPIFKQWLSKRAKDIRERYKEATK